MAIPHHVAIILDGNRRYARRLMQQPWEGHRVGLDKAKDLFAWACDLNIKELTLYCFSMQNFNRPKLEFDFLMDIFTKAFTDALQDPTVLEKQIRFRALGRVHLLPKKVQEAIRNLEDVTRHHKNYQVNICLAYGGREEILDAVNRLLKDNVRGEITEGVFQKYLYTDAEPDIIIRTAGDMRTSNFLPWQSVYSEWFFLEKTWPEFTRDDLVRVIEEFHHRERRFGR